jgi:hypothetical protein
MGYMVPTSNALLVFENNEFEGAEVRCIFDVSFDVFFMYQRLAAQKDIEAIRATLVQFGDEIIMSWNLEDKDGKPIPVSGENLCKQPIKFGGALLRNWIGAMTVPPPVPPSTSGEPSAVATTAPAT